MPLAKGARGGAEIGDLVTVSMRGRAGRVTAVHGPASSPRAALRALLASEDLGRPFPRAALDESEALDDGDVAGDRGRRDLRDQRVITIDPEGAKDHDDAIAIAPEGDGATRLWVHIADVAPLRRRGRAPSTARPPAAAVGLRARGGRPDAPRRACPRTSAACAPASTAPR